MSAVCRNSFFSTKVNLLNFKLSNQAKNIPGVLPSSPIQIWSKSVKVFMDYDLTNRDYTYIKKKDCTRNSNSGENNKLKWLQEMFSEKWTTELFVSNQA